MDPVVQGIGLVWAFTPIGWGFTVVVACILANAWEVRVDGESDG